jgi:threonine aldolase
MAALEFGVARSGTAREAMQGRMSEQRTDVTLAAMIEIEFRSDNAAGVAPEIMAAVAETNAGTALAYGADAVTAQLETVVRDVFEHRSARVFPVTSGTAANALSLTSLCPPWGSVLCHESAHILNSECGATSLLGGGAVIRGVPGDDFRVRPDTLQDALDQVRWGDPHHSQPAVLSLTEPTDMGTVYAVDEVAALSSIAHDQGLRVHLDGARVANAIAALGCSPADLTWRAGVDVLSLGATKNGALSSEAIVVFDDDAADELLYRTKRAGHVTSKMRFQSAQLIAYLTNGLWLRLAAHSNRQMERLAAGLAGSGIGFVNRPDVNMLFAMVDEEAATRLEAEGVLFYRISPGVIRLVTSWQTTDADVDRALARFAGVLGA